MPGIKGRHLTEKGLFVKMNDLIIKKKKKSWTLLFEYTGHRSMEQCSVDVLDKD